MPRKKVVHNRREAIIQTADKLFSHSGYDKTTMEDISRQSGVPRATVYLEFPGGKQDILMASASLIVDVILEDMQALAVEHSEDPLKALHDGLILNIQRVHIRCREQHVDYSNIAKHMSRAEVVLDRFHNGRDALILQLLEKANAAGHLKPDFDLPLIASFILKASLLFNPPAYETDEIANITAVADVFLRVFIDGLRQ